MKNPSSAYPKERIFYRDRRQADDKIPVADGAIAPHESRPGVKEATSASFFSLGAVRWWLREVDRTRLLGPCCTRRNTTGQSAAKRLSRIDVGRTTKSLAAARMLSRGR
ncbi:hypothetical protein MRX96_041639 [Rhipicephalus microplus]